MFTGIVEGMGKIAQITNRRDGTRRVTVDAAFALGKLPKGASIAVDGVCLTVTSSRGRRFSADLGPETLACTNLDRLQKGVKVHLERPMRLGDPVGGHLVAGHVDGTGRVLAARRDGRALELRVEVPGALAAEIAPKGSVAIDGVSLTVNRVVGGRFSVMLIPHTLKMTCLGKRAPGDRVNIETDLIAKHVTRTVMRLFGEAITKPKPARRGRK